MDIILMLHSLVRWAIVVVAVIAAVKFALGWLRGGQYGSMDRGLASGFSGLMDLQAALGVIYLVWSGLARDGFPAYRLVHTIVMVAAVAIAHLPRRWKSAPDPLRYRNTLLSILGALLLIVVGIAALPQGWFG